jgi:hypothetical protein
MRKHWLVGASLVAALTVLGCASFEAYEKLLGTWLGDTEANLVSKWGPPQNVYVSPDGNRILTYYSQRTIVLPGYTAPTTTYLSGTNYGGTFSGTATSYNYSTPPMVLDMKCQTNFTVRQAQIVSWSYNGNDCKA